MRSTLRNLLLSLIVLISTAPLAADTPGEWRRLGPDGGSVFDLVAAPSNPLVLYAVAEGAVYKSVDGGASWAYTGYGSSRYGSAVGLAVDAVDPSKIYGNVVDNLFRSLDGGQTWDFIAPAGRVNDVAAHPRRAGLVFVATDAGLFRSSDAGTTWTKLGQGLPQSYRATFVMVDPFFPNRLFAETQNPRSSKFRLFKSLDAGVSWQAADVGSVLGNRVVAIATDPRSPKTLYASNLGNLYRSTDGGATWKRRNRPEGSGSLLALTVLPTQPETLYAGGGTGLYRSRNGGAIWEKLTQGFPEGGAVNALVVSSGAAGPSLLAGVSTFIRRGGVFRSSDAGTSWSLYSQGITATAVTAIGFGPPGTLWVVANGVLFRSIDQGVTWSRIRPGPPTSFYVNRVVVDPIDRSNVFVSLIDGQVRRSDDGGATWEIAGSPSNQTTFYPFDLVIDPKTPSTLYAAGYRIAKSTDRGSTWKELETGGHSGFFDLAISPSSPSTLYALGDKSLILRSTDGGAIWSARLRIARNLLPNSIVVDPLLPKTVYIVSEQGIHKTKDGGETWTLFSDSFTGRPAFPLEMSPSGLLYVGVWYDKLYSIRDGDDAWSVLEGSGPWEFRTLAFDPHDPCRIYVGAAGQSLLVFTRSGTAECPGTP